MSIVFFFKKKRYWCSYHDYNVSLQKIPQQIYEEKQCNKFLIYMTKESALGLAIVAQAFNPSAPVAGARGSL